MRIDKKKDVAAKSQSQTLNFGKFNSSFLAERKQIRSIKEDNRTMLK